MSRNPEVSLTLRLHGQNEFSAGLRQQTEMVARFGQVARQQTSHFNQFGKAAHRALSGSINLVRNLHSELNGLSEVSKIVAALGGLSLARDVIRGNLNFERDLLEMKQNAQMTIAQSKEIRQLAIDAADGTLQTPQEVLSAAKAFARAGESFDNIKVKTIEAARAATVFRSTTEEIANMDFDITDKLKVDPKRLKDVHNMLYYHGNAGRFEAPKMAQFAPELFNAVSNIGIGGERGLNFTGALTQVLMKSASINEPGKVKTLMEQGLSHITDSSYVRNLKKATGINVKKYAPGGKFYGEGGVDGLLDLADAMKSKGLNDPFKLNAAGFKDTETVKFWRSMMQYSDQIRSEMNKGEVAAKNDQISVDLSEMKDASFGKIKAAEIKAEKLKLSDSAVNATVKTADLAQWAGENPGKAVAAGIATALAGKWAWGKGIPRLIEWAGKNFGRGAREIPNRPSLKVNAAGAPVNTAEIQAWERKYSKLTNQEKPGLLRNIRDKLSTTAPTDSSHEKLTRPSLKVKNTDRLVDTARIKDREPKYEKPIGQAKPGILKGIGGKLNTAAAISFAGYEAWQISHDEQLSQNQKNIAYAGLAGSTVGSLAGGGAARLLGLHLVRYFFRELVR
ncbi:phage tail tape measure protein [Chromobacterium vaccinii]|uniref:phage tail tape measure protein n=1 Tax=Chromobacterium vaccinii TaxID=1108595 RepID=UPI000E19AD54|nr:phage tail tape measure protein [Chromobacterium vaccinii]SUX54401.1 phage tail tape measure protein, TP901 family, core region [Chromobacterium vaccinii]